jgi:hypothetical protein
MPVVDPEMVQQRLHGKKYVWLLQEKSRC